MNPEPKISTVEIVFITPLFLLTDAIGILLVLVGLDDVFILDVIRTLPSQAYLWFKGVRGTYMLTANLIEFIPYVGALPAATAGWLVTVWIDRHPQSAVAKTVQTAAAAVPTGKGGKGAVGVRPAVKLPPTPSGEAVATVAKSGGTVLRPTNFGGIKKAA